MWLFTLFITLIAAQDLSGRWWYFDSWYGKDKRGPSIVAADFEWNPIMAIPLNGTKTIFFEKYSYSSSDTYKDVETVIAVPEIKFVYFFARGKTSSLVRVSFDGRIVQTLAQGNMTLREQFVVDRKNNAIWFQRKQYPLGNVAQTFRCTLNGANCQPVPNVSSTYGLALGFILFFLFLFFLFFFLIAKV